MLCGGRSLGDLKTELAYCAVNETLVYYLVSYECCYPSQFGMPTGDAYFLEKVCSKMNYTRLCY